MFTGFSDATVDFLWGIRFNNEKSWFEANKPDYLTHLYTPMKMLAAEVYEGFMEGAPDWDLRCRVSRIYRDARRLRGRGPYKESLWFTIEEPAEDWSCNPVFWFEVAPEGYSYGMGAYAPAAVTMAKFRARLDRKPKDFEKLAKAIVKDGTFSLSGAEYKRSKGETTPALASWYNRKGFSLSCQRNHDGLLYSEDLVGCLVEDFEKLRPIYQYFKSLEGDPDPRI